MVHNAPHEMRVGSDRVQRHKMAKLNFLLFVENVRRTTLHFVSTALAFTRTEPISRALRPPCVCVCVHAIYSNRKMPTTNTEKSGNSDFLFIVCKIYEFMSIALNTQLHMKRFESIWYFLSDDALANSTVRDRHFFGTGNDVNYSILYL